LVITQNRNTIEFLGIWEHLNNPGFKPLEFEGFKKRAGLNLFKVEKGCNEADSGKTVSHIEAEKLLYSALKSLSGGSGR